MSFLIKKENIFIEKIDTGTKLILTQTMLFHFESI